MSKYSISKTLSGNDVGATGAHQAGILVPKRKEILSFFPTLPKKMKNPRFQLIFTDDAQQRWEFTFIYYNNRLFGGTRNEYRLTWMTRYIRENNLKPGDEIILTKDEEDALHISFRRGTVSGPGKLKLSGEWKIINI